MSAASRLATYEDLVRLPGDERAEIIRGAIRTQPGALPDHGRVLGPLWRRVGGPFDDDDGRGGPGGWWIIPEVDVRLDPNNVVRPDLAGWRRARLPSPSGIRPIDVVPDWVCEILSPSNEAHDRVTKRRLYAEFGVAFYWLVSPAERTLEAVRLVDGTWVDAGTFDETAVVRIPPFEAIELVVADVFPPRAFTAKS